MSQNDRGTNGRRAGAPRAPHLGVLLAALLALPAARAAAQAPVRLFAAQTGPDEVTFSWDSIPGTNEYLIYAAPADSLTGNLRLRPPLLRLNGRSRTAVSYGVPRLSGGVTLVAMAATGRVIQKAEFNRITRATSFAPIQPPEEVTAETTGPTEITLSWTPVPGATAYYIGRAVPPGGMSTLCRVCSSEPRYVDEAVVPGASVRYAVAAIFPNGKSQPAPSNPVVAGVTAPATYTKTAPATTLSGGAATTTSTSTTASYNPTTQLTTYVTTTTVCTVAAPITCTTSQSSTTSGPPTGSATPGPTSTGTTSPATTGTSTPSSTATTSSVTGAPDTASARPSGPLSSVLGGVLGTLGGATGSVSPPPFVNAVSPAPASVRLTWQASPTANIGAYRVSRRINSGVWELLATVGGSTLTYTDNFFPITMFASGPVWVSYSVVAVHDNVSSDAAVTGTLSVSEPVPTSPTATTSTTRVNSCKLDYMRADNMWAAFGRPDGLLGTETISLTPGQDKVFITDWSYEKQHNDGTNYYGSHLRMATNNSTRTIRLQLRTLTLTGLVVYVRTGSDTFWIRLDPGKTQQFQADLMEVFCEN